MGMFINDGYSLPNELFKIDKLAVFQAYLHRTLVQQFQIEYDTNNCFVIGTIS
jgi:hypothetical protein